MMPKKYKYILILTLYCGKLVYYNTSMCYFIIYIIVYSSNMAKISLLSKDSLISFNKKDKKEGGSDGNVYSIDIGSDVLQDSLLKYIKQLNKHYDIKFSKNENTVNVGNRSIIPLYKYLESNDGILNINNSYKLIYDITNCFNILKDLKLSVLNVNVYDFHVLVGDDSGEVYDGDMDEVSDEVSDEVVNNNVVFLFTGTKRNGLFKINDDNNIVVENDEYLNMYNDEKTDKQTDNNTLFISPEIYQFINDNDIDNDNDNDNVNADNELMHYFDIRTTYYIISLFIINMLFGKNLSFDNKSIGANGANNGKEEEIFSILKPLYYTKLYYFLLRCLQPDINNRFFCFI